MIREQPLGHPYEQTQLRMHCGGAGGKELPRVGARFIDDFDDILV